jgi:hypothetical protein
MKTSHTNAKARLFEVETNVLKTFCEEHPSEVTLRVLNILRRNAWDEYIDFDFNPSRYGPDEIARLRADYQAVSMLKKSMLIPIAVDKRQKALDTFTKAELQCEKANDRILSWGSNPNEYPELIEIVAKAQSIIRHILGPLDEDSLSYVQSHCRFGPGSTRSVSRRPTQGRKFDNPRPMATPRVAEFLSPLLPIMWADRLVRVELQAASKITTVPKSAKTDRTIGIEPDLNIYLQLGIGALIRNRLCQHGVNLAKQADRNAVLASQAHLLGLSTIDLSSASDCVNRSLVELLLPEEWRHLLRIARTDYYELDGVVKPFHKWSSMGNGYTFELETLIFLALARASGDPRAVSYGDDIIVKSDCAPTLLTALNFLGFSVNSEKTYLTGLFFESCGSDWFCGINVRPFFLRGNPEKLEENYDPKKPDAAYLAVLYQYANSISVAAYRSNRGFGRDHRYFSSWRSVYKSAPPSARLRIPAGFNTSGGFESDWDECSHPSASTFQYLAFEPSRGHVRGDWGPLLAWFSSCEARDPGILSRGRVTSSVASLRSLALRLADVELKTDSYHLDGETYRGEGSHKIKIGSCFAWANRGPWS